jgi:hypothetical protein
MYSRIAIFNLKDFKWLISFSIFGEALDYYYPMAFSPDSKYFVYKRNGHLNLYETDTWNHLWDVPICQ